jgi:hypothetical protein
MLFARGDDIGCVMKGRVQGLGRKRTIDFDRDACMLHDDMGEKWPKCSLLIMSIRASDQKATDEEMRGAPEHYLGRDYAALVGRVDTPPKDLRRWEYVGDVKKIYYYRLGTRAPGGFKHHFNRPRGIHRITALVLGKREVKLYRLGDAYRLELGGGCLVSDLGLVHP